MAAQQPGSSLSGRKLLLVSHEFTRSGAPLCLLQITEALQSAGAHCFIVGPPEGPLIARFGKIGATLTLVGPIHWLYGGGRRTFTQILYLPVRVAANLVVLLRLVREIRRIDPEVILLNSFASRFAILPAIFSGKTIMWYLHEYYELPWLMTNVVSSFMRRYVDIVMANSVFTLRTWGLEPGARAQVIYNGIETSEHLRIRLKKKYDVAFVGRICREKGVEALVDAVAELKRQNLPVTVVVAGAVEDTYFLAQLKNEADAEGIASQITWLGEVDSINEILEDALILVLPSNREGLGRVLLEAMAKGVAVIGSDVGGIREIIDSDNNGLLCRADNPRMLADQIKKLLQDNHLREKLARNGFRTVKEKFSVSEFRRKVEIAFLQLTH